MTEKNESQARREIVLYHGSLDDLNGYLHSKVRQSPENLFFVSSPMRLDSGDLEKALEKLGIDGLVNMRTSVTGIPDHDGEVYAIYEGTPVFYRR